MFTIAPIKACEVNAFGSVYLSICLPVCARHSKTFPTIYFIFYTRSIIHVARSSSRIIITMHLLSAVHPG